MKDPARGRGRGREATPSLTYRPLKTLEDFEACVALQREVWGADFEECVPGAILRVAARYGGVLEGAFGGPNGGRLVGFVFGLTGLDQGRPVHWSDMLAVAPGWRGQGIGGRLKERQRLRLLELGVHEVRWSFDPLEARNARLNLSRLGAVGRWYERDMYGASSSPLHAGIGTDRLVVSWWIGPGVAPWDRGSAPGSRPSGPRPSDARSLEAGSSAPDPSTSGPEAVAPDGSDTGAGEGVLVPVPIPRDLQRLKAEDPEGARQWRLRVRAALEAPLAAGGSVVGFRDHGPPADPVLLLAPFTPPTPRP